MKMRRFTGLLRKHEPLRLGRWSVHEPSSVTIRKAELASHDHCGPCALEQGAFDSSMDETMCALESMHRIGKEDKKNPDR